jgi:hypothetical protein
MSAIAAGANAPLLTLRKTFLSVIKREKEILCAAEHAMGGGASQLRLG